MLTFSDFASLVSLALGLHWVVVFLFWHSWRVADGACPTELLFLFVAKVVMLVGTEMDNLNKILSFRAFFWFAVYAMATIGVGVDEFVVAFAGL